MSEKTNFEKLEDILKYCADLIRQGEGHNNPVRVDTMLERLSQLSYVKFVVHNHVLIKMSVIYQPGDEETPSYEDTIDYYRQLLTSLANKMRRTPDQLLKVNDIQDKEEIIQCYNNTTLTVPNGITEIAKDAFIGM